LSEQKRGEQALRRSEAYLADAQRLTHTGSWAYDVFAGKVTYSSHEHSRLYGLDSSKGIPSYEEFRQRTHPEDFEPLLEAIESAARAGTDVEHNFRIVLPDGTIRHVHGLGHPVFNASGGLVEYVGIMTDVTERVRADEEHERLRQLQADLAYLSRVTTMGELTASLAHEIKQPITAAVTDAKTCLRWLGRDCPDVQEAREAASRIVNDVTRAADIITSLSLFFKKGTVQREMIDINELIREMIVLLRNEANRYSISVHTELTEGISKIMADRVQLQQVFMNLMLNAVDAMKESAGGGELRIKSEAHDGQLLISVSDTGVGIPPHQVDKIFESFFTTKGHGIGMGLPISRSIIESHGGRLWATNSTGRGATFQFTLPTAVAAHGLISVWDSPKEHGETRRSSRGVSLFRGIRIRARCESLQ
jgi:PAS domain S-box-containing protein